MRIRSTSQVGVLLASTLTLAACGSSGSGSDGLTEDDSSAVAEMPVTPAPSVTAPTTPDVNVTDVSSDVAPVTPPPVTPLATPPAAAPEPPPIETPSAPVSEPITVVPPTAQTPVQGAVPALVQSNLNAGITASGGDDDSPTETESLSLVGPFLKDTNRSAGPPSVPTGLVALMKSYDWVEFSWVPSVDDQSVEGYEILRDGTPVFTVRGDTDYEFDYRSWLSTSYMDCNFTRYTVCENNQPASGSTHEYSVIAIDNEGLRSAPSAPVSITLAQADSTPFDVSGFNLILNEEFDGDSLDRNIWKTSLAWGPDEIINREMQYFVNLFDNDEVNYNPFVFTGTTLQITGIPTPAEELAAANNQPYLSGVINSQDNFSFTYGYVEMNAKVASGRGLLSTFFLFNQSFEDNQPEIDILEYIGDRSNTAYQTYHYYDSNRSRYGTGERHSSPTMQYDAGFDFASGFHTYGVLWEPELAIWYIDGIEVGRLEGPRVSDEPMNIVSQLVLGSEWIGAPDAAAIPAVLEIDYIRAYQRQ